VIVGTKDLLGEKNFQKAEGLFGQQLEIKSYQMGHFPSPENLEKIDTDIRAFLKKHY
jgi:hypothetical protein